MHRSVNEIAYAEGAFLLGFPISSQNRHSMRVIVGLDFTGDNRRGAPQRSNQCGDCYSTQKSVHKSGDKNAFCLAGMSARPSASNSETHHAEPYVGYPRFQSAQQVPLAPVGARVEPTTGNHCIGAAKTIRFLKFITVRVPHWETEPYFPRPLI